MTCGGGVNPERQTTNPAWDFQYPPPRYEVKSEYTFRARVVSRERCSRAKVLREYQTWRQSLRRGCTCCPVRNASKGGPCKPAG